MQTGLLDFVMSGLQARKGQWPLIAEESGVDYSWLSKLASGRIPNPGVRQIERVASYLKAREEATQSKPE